MSRQPIHRRERLRRTLAEPRLAYRVACHDSAMVNYTFRGTAPLLDEAGGVARALM
jgi:hypothetical protein